MSQMRMPCRRRRSRHRWNRWLVEVCAGGAGVFVRLERDARVVNMQAAIRIIRQAETAACVDIAKDGITAQRQVIRGHLGGRLVGIAGEIACREGTEIDLADVVIEQDVALAVVAEGAIRVEVGHDIAMDIDKRGEDRAVAGGNARDLVELHLAVVIQVGHMHQYLTRAYEEQVTAAAAGAGGEHLVGLQEQRGHPDASRPATGDDGAEHRVGRQLDIANGSRGDARFQRFDHSVTFEDLGGF